MSRPCLNKGGPSSRVLLPSVPILGQPVPVGDELLSTLELWQVRPGDAISAVDPEGGIWRSRRDDTEGSHVLVPYEKMTPSPESFLQLHLFQAFSRREEFELVLKQATELGVKRIIPFESQHSTRLEGPESGDDSSCRWIDVVLQAARQCRRFELPELAPVADWDSALYEATHADLKLLLVEGECQWHLREVLQDEKPHRIALMVGPKGGFSDEEIAEAQQFGFLPVTLGSRRLCPESVALAATAIIQAQLGDLG